MNYAFRNDENIVYNEKNDGCITNVSAGIVLLRTPDRSELRALFNKFDSELQGRLKRFMCAPTGEVLERFGTLHLREGIRSPVEMMRPYALRSYGKGQKLNLMNKGALNQSLVDLGHISKLTVHGTPRKRFPRGHGDVLQRILSLDASDQKLVLENLIDNYDPDYYLNVVQGSKIGFTELRDFVFSDRPVSVILDRIAQSFAVEMGQGGYGASAEEISALRIEYAPVWFSHFLARNGVWLLPLSIAHNVRRSYPKTLFPLLVWSAVPDDCLDIAENVCRLEKGKKRHLSDSSCINVFVATSLASDTWRMRRFCAEPFVRFKEYIAPKDHGLLSSSCNFVYKFLFKEFGRRGADHPELAVFTSSLRMDGQKHSPFEFCFRPTIKNTKFAARLLERPVEEVPSFVKSWALQLREVLPSFEVKYMGQVVRWLTPWLCFLMTLNPQEAPHTFEEISREKHVYNEREFAKTYSKFLQFYVNKLSGNAAQKCISKMAQAWGYASKKGGFSSRLANPFDTYVDHLGSGRKRGRRAKTTRKAMDPRVFFLLLNMNRQGFYEFARADKRNTKQLLNPETGKIEEVFVPLAAATLDVIFSTGSRNMDARWIDSGEGDEKVVDLDSMTLIQNTAASAISGRKSGFIRLLHVSGTDAKPILGMYKNSNKTGILEEIPYLPQALARNIAEIAKIQALYNPMDGPEKLLDVRYRSTVDRPELYEYVFPVFREVDEFKKVAISRERIMGHYISLLKHAQPAVDKLMGYHYPLLRNNGKAVFDIHSLRVSLVTYLLDNGADIEAVQTLVGHAAAIMTFYYKAINDRRVHESLSEIIAKADEQLAMAQIGDLDSLIQIVRSAIIPSGLEHHVGELLLEDLLTGKNDVDIEWMDHGICVGGSCASGFGKKQGVNLRVWRARACSQCRYRLTGPHFFMGLIRRCNSLMVEIIESVKRIAEFNRRIEALETTTGKKHDALRLSAANEDRLREELCLEWLVESKTAFAIQDRMRTALGQLTGSREEHRSGDLEPELEWGLQVSGGSEIELFNTVVRSVMNAPLSEWEFSSEKVRGYLAKLKRLVVVNSLEGLLIKMPDDTESEQLITLTQLLEAKFGSEALSKFMTDSDELRVTPELVASEIAASVLAKMPVPRVGHVR